MYRTTAIALALISVIPVGAQESPAHFADAIYAHVRAIDSGRNEGSAYALSTGNALRRVVQTPNFWAKLPENLPFFEGCKGNCNEQFRLPNCGPKLCSGLERCVALHALNVDPTRESTEARRVCVGHSDDHLVDAVYDIITTAKESVVIATMNEPTGRFKSGIQNAITYLAKSGRKVDIEILVGDPTATIVSHRAIGAYVQGARGVAGSKIRLLFVAGRAAPIPTPSWNHAKIVASESSALVGGHNQWESDYLLQAPVHDLSLIIDGPAAAAPHGYTGPVIREICGQRTVPNLALYNGEKDAVFRVSCEDVPAFGGFTQARPQGTAKILAVANFGRRVLPSSQRSDFSPAARVKAFDMATKIIEISQQNIGGGTQGWPDETLRALAAAALRGVDIYIVTSSPGAKAGSGVSYSLNASNATLAKKIKDAATPLHKKRSSLEDILCSKVRLAEFRFSVFSDTWPPKGNKPGNHAKFWMVDRQAFYVGSENIYPARHQEFGYIVDDTASATRVHGEYYDVLWRNAVRTAVSGPEVPRDKCAFRLP